MVHYPEVQAIAQAEIDRVVGQDRLPTYSDRLSLPYVEAVYKEVLRWHPVAPLGVPHCLDWDKDDVYRGESHLRMYA
jgi:cytochrome P450